MKKLLFLLGIICFTTSVYGQDVKHTKMEDFVSKTGVLIKYQDYALPSLKTTYATAETKVRELIIGGNIAYFYQISYKKKYTTKTASIAYEDLLEVIKAFQTLLTESVSDKLSKSDYLENRFVTDDGFEIGYFVSKEKLDWYLVLEKYGSDNTIFIKDVSTIEAAFNMAKTKIESLKN